MNEPYNSITIINQPNPGEKYRRALAWRKGDGRPTAENVERRVQGCKFVEVRRHSCWTWPELQKTTFTYVIVEMTAK